MIGRTHLNSVFYYYYVKQLFIKTYIEIWWGNSWIKSISIHDVWIGEQIQWFIYYLNYKIMYNWFDNSYYLNKRTKISTIPLYEWFWNTFKMWMNFCLLLFLLLRIKVSIYKKWVATNIKHFGIRMKQKKNSSRWIIILKVREYLQNISKSYFNQRFEFEK